MIDAIDAERRHSKSVYSMNYGKISQLDDVMARLIVLVELRFASVVAVFRREKSFRSRSAC